MSTKKIKVLRDITLGAGVMAHPDEVHEVSAEVAHSAVSYGNARYLTDDEVSDDGDPTTPPDTVEHRDPSATHRDPRVRRK